MKNKRKLLWLLPAILIVVGLLWHGNRVLTVSRFTVASDKIPEAFDGFTIVQVSDLHNTEFGKGNARLLAELSALNPDILVITGDMWDSRNTDIEIGLAFAQAAAKIAPTYYVSGNHEARLGNSEQLWADLEKVNVQVLENEKVLLTRSGESITLAGIMDPSFYTGYLLGSEADVAALLLSELLPQENYTVLLSHRPELFPLYVKSGVDLVFSGHAHGGQFRLPFAGGVIAPSQGFFPRYDAGLYTENITSMVVSRGLGNSIIPLRVNNPPDIVAVELRKK